MAIQLQLADVDKIKMLEYTLTGTTDQLAWFIESRPDDINLKDSKIGNCAMHIASFRGNVNKVELLIRKNADMNQQDIVSGFVVFSMDHVCMLKCFQLFAVDVYCCDIVW